MCAKEKLKLLRKLYELANENDSVPFEGDESYTEDCISHQGCSYSDIVNEILRTIDKL